MSFLDQCDLYKLQEDGGGIFLTKNTVEDASEKSFLIGTYRALSQMNLREPSKKNEVIRQLIKSGSILLDQRGSIQKLSVSSTQDLKEVVGGGWLENSERTHTKMYDKHDERFNSRYYFKKERNKIYQNEEFKNSLRKVISERASSAKELDYMSGYRTEDAILYYTTAKNNAGLSWNIEGLLARERYLMDQSLEALHILATSIGISAWICLGNDINTLPDILVKNNAPCFYGHIGMHDRLSSYEKQAQKLIWSGSYSNPVATTEFKQNPGAVMRKAMEMVYGQEYFKPILNLSYKVIDEVF